MSRKKHPTEMKKRTDFDVAARKMYLLGLRAKDPSHPWHRRLEWQDGKPVVPDSDKALAEILLAALDEPELS